MFGLGEVGACIECLMAYEHAMTERTPREIVGRSKAARMQQLSFIVYDIGVAIEHSGQRLAIAHTFCHHLQRVGRGKHIAGVKEEHIVARGLSYGFVHGIIQSAIGF